MSSDAFNYGEPIAYSLTWTTYGTWMPGDERGWHRKGSGAYHPPNEMIRHMAESDMKETAFVMTTADRELVEQTIAKHCEIRRWHLHTVNARSNHVHVVVTALGYSGETIRDQFKAWCSRKLKAFHPDRQRFWTEGACCRPINNQTELESAILYAHDAQDQKHKE